MQATNPAIPDVILLTASGCPHCPVVHKLFGQLKSAGKIGELQVFDITQQPRLTDEYNVRSVPWFRINDLEFQGLHSASELEYWVTHASSDEGIRLYLIQELESGQLPLIDKLLQKHAHWWPVAVTILADMQAPIQARIGLGAIIEGLQGEPRLTALVQPLSELTRHADQRVRSDACYFLGLTGQTAARPALQACLNDSVEEVREIAEEALLTIPG